MDRSLYLWKYNGVCSSHYPSVTRTDENWKAQLLRSWSTFQSSLGRLCVCAPVCSLSHRVSLVPICCLNSSLSWSDCLGRIFFSSSSLTDGRLLILMAKESFLNTFRARVPTHTHKRYCPLNVYKIELLTPPVANSCTSNSIVTTFILQWALQDGSVFTVSNQLLCLHNQITERREVCVCV